MEYSGFDAGAYGVNPSLSKAQAVVEWPIATSVKDVLSFMGLASFSGNLFDSLVRSQLLN